MCQFMMFSNAPGVWLPAGCCEPMRVSFSRRVQYMAQSTPKEQLAAARFELCHVQEKACWLQRQL